MSDSRSLRTQLLWSQLRVAALASGALLLILLAVNLLAIPIGKVKSTDVPTVHAAMQAQLGLQRSASALQTWVALARPAGKNELEKAWTNEIEPAIAAMQKIAHDDQRPELLKTLNTLNDKLIRLKDLQQWIVDVSTKPGNEPARMVYTGEFTPLAQNILAMAEAQGASAGLKARSEVMNLRIHLAELSEALGRFVVDGRPQDATLASTRLERFQSTLNALRTEYFNQPLASVELQESNINLAGLVESIIAARRSPRSNVAWHTVGTKAQPLAQEISDELGTLADTGVSRMSENVTLIVSAVGYLAVGAFAVFVVLSALSIFMARRDASRLSAPVTALSQAAHSIGRGEFAGSLPNSNTTEVQTLIDSFQQMRNAIAESHSSLLKMAQTDELTGLRNRKGFNQAIRELEHKRRTGPSESSAIAHIDFDHFKQVNDSHGHDLGDHILRVFSQRLTSCMRQSDIAARMGGDEFAIIINDLGAPDEIHQIIARVLRVLEKPIVYGDKTFESSATIGVFVSQDPTDSAEDMLKRADIALYEAKEEKRGSYRVYNETTHQRTRRDRDLLSLIKNSPPEDIFKLHFQPIVELESLEVVEVETLLRVQPGLADAVPIPDVIDLMEKNGQITRVSGWIVVEALRTLVSFHKTPPLSELKISINISTIMLHDPSFASVILAALKETGVPANRLVLEITETMVLKDFTVAFRAMEELSRAGVQFALDDFGTGYSSMIRLKQMPLSRLKIDRGFIADMLVDNNDAAIVEASLQLAHTMGLQVTAEGIENIAQANELRRLNCGYGQGYLFGRPVPAEDLMASITNFDTPKPVPLDRSERSTG